MKYNNDYQILQIYLDNFKLDNLYEKYPIIIYDQVYKVNDLLKTIFAYSFLFKKELDIQPEKVYKNIYKYLLISSDDNVSIKIINPKYKKDIKNSLQECNVQYVTIKLKENQVLILPALWYYSTDNIDIKAIGLDDILSKIIYAFF
jgi:hypothetical protein